MVERRIKEARFPAVKSLDSFDFAAIPSLNKTLVLELARSEYVTRRENIIAVGNSGTGKTHIGLGLGLAACQKGLSVGFNTAAALVHELLEARDEKRLLRLQRQLAGYKLLIIDELGYVPLSQTGAEPVCERHECSWIASNRPRDHCQPSPLRGGPSPLRFLRRWPLTLMSFPPEKVCPPAPVRRDFFVAHSAGCSSLSYITAAASVSKNTTYSSGPRTDLIVPSYQVLSVRSAGGCALTRSPFLKRRP